MAPTGGPGWAAGCSQHSLQPRPPHKRQQCFRAGTAPVSEGSSHDWQFCWAGAQPPPTHAAGRRPWCAQPISPAKTIRVRTENIARFMSGNSLFPLVRLGGKDRIRMRENSFPPSSDIGLTIVRVQKIGRTASFRKTRKNGPLGTSDHGVEWVI
jgi:hypothetical protein